MDFRKADLEGLHFKRKGGTSVWPHAPAFPENAEFVSWDAETSILTYRVPNEPEEGEAVVYSEHELEVTQAMIDQAVEDITAPVPTPLAPLRDRLKAKAGGFPAQVRAGFPFERVAYWLDQGDEETAKAVIEGVDVSGFPQPIQDAKAAMLEEFNA